MNDLQLSRLLTEEDPTIAAVLMSRGGWLSSPGDISIRVQFPAGAEGSILWAIRLYAEEENEPYHVLYTTSDAIVGVSCRRYPDAAEQERGRQTA